MPKPDTKLCRNFCAYYRPGKNEDLLCQGFLVVHRLLQSGRRFSLERPVRTAVPDRRSAEGLRKRVCAVCSFRAADCDYIATEGAAAPCGGIALLSHLLGAGELALEETGEETAA
jgi:hypothetical protein